LSKETLVQHIINKAKNTLILGKTLTGLHYAKTFACGQSAQWAMLIQHTSREEVTANSCEIEC
jgi:hypothetical protein